MWFDPSSGQFFADPEKLLKTLREADPLMQKAFLHPEQLTVEECRQVELMMMGTLSGLLPKSVLEELIRENRGQREKSPDPAHEDAVNQVLEGNLALREMGVLKERNIAPEVLLSALTGQVFPQAKVAAERRGRKGKGKKRKPKS